MNCGSRHCESLREANRCRQAGPGWRGACTRSQDVCIDSAAVLMWLRLSASKPICAFSSAAQLKLELFFFGQDCFHLEFSQIGFSKEGLQHAGVCGQNAEWKKKDYNLPCSMNWCTQISGIPDMLLWNTQIHSTSLTNLFQSVYWEKFFFNALKDAHQSFLILTSPNTWFQTWMVRISSDKHEVKVHYKHQAGHLEVWITERISSI